VVEFWSTPQKLEHLQRTEYQSLPELVGIELLNMSGLVRFGKAHTGIEQIKLHGYFIAGIMRRMNCDGKDQKELTK
jgi:hypothetical protein